MNGDTLGSRSRTIRIDIIPDLLTPPRPVPAGAKTVRLRRRQLLAVQSPLQELAPLGGPDFQELLQQAYDAALITDADGIIAESNARATEFLGWTRRDLRDRSIDSVISGWTTELLNTVHRSLDEDRYVLLQAYCARNDATFFPGEIAIIRLNVSGALYFCFFIRDITLRRRTENRLRIGFNAIENAGDAILISDIDGVIGYANAAAVRLWGRASADDLVGQPLRALLHEPPEVAMQAVSAGQTWSGELIALRTEEEGFHIRLSAAPNLDGDGQWLGAVLSVQDITERKLTERKLRKTLDDLSRSNADLREFAYVASHDLQEPLRKITVFSDFLRESAGTSLPPEAMENLGRIEKASRRMSALIEGILELSRVSTGARGFAEIDMARAAQEVVSDLEFRIRERNATVEIGDLPVIEAEPIQIRQLLQNLIGNALKFARKDVAPRIRLYARRLDGFPTEGPTPTWEITVEDNGIGFDAAYADRIFGIFQRLHSRQEYEGTGIGLAVCRKIVQRHGGAIRAESQPGQGSRFIITLPARQPASPDPAADNGA